MPHKKTGFMPVFLCLPRMGLLKNIATGAFLLMISSAFLLESVVDEALPAIVFGAYRQQKTRLVTKTGFVWWALSDSNTRPTD